MSKHKGSNCTIWLNGKRLDGLLTFEQVKKGEGIMKIKELINDVYDEIEKENEERVKEILKERIRELRAMKAAIKIAEKQFTELLHKDVNDVAEY
jgi:hypothetical protein